ncbi:diguanylate cyclase [Paenibacillus sp. Root52]|uniref:Diguanylate cyclase (GGDEF)-like protein n=1 Tax=Paenibacillus amylolyticus TaxID=1451 RepID=A0AAP5H3P3_PAEAM|nr:MULTISPECIES: diguanylate cyclase [Paenibacillus]KQY87548.1 diguanylate cyclase [Paenibacillus sp. Root52]MDR6725292.1 diguanylate cyclase (GGDEF)-like protein [Paenibacillus amylolyticus]
MLEHLGSLPASLNSPSSGDPASAASLHNEHALWMQQVDITPFDFSYLGSLLQQAFADWQQQRSPAQDHAAMIFNVWNTEGVRVGDPYEDAVSMDVSLTVLRCLETGQEQTLRSSDQHGQFHLLALPLYSRSNKDMFAVFTALIYEPNPYETSEALVRSEASHYRTCFYRRFEYIFMTDLLHAHEQTAREEHRRSILFQIVQRMHDNMDVDTILDEVFGSMDYLYPTMRITLFMSQDQSSTNARIKPLLVHERGEDICVRSFMEGRLIVARSIDGENRITEVGLPLKGKQGIYGVFYIEMNDELMEESDLQLITMMADTAGTAFENAKLHEQSNMLIQELRLINDLTQRLNKSLQLMEIFQFAEQEMLGIFQAESCCILQLNDSTNQFEVMSSNVHQLTRQSFPNNYGIAGALYQSEEPLIMSNYRQHAQFPSQFMEQTKSLSLIASPVWVNGEVKCVIMLGHTQEQFFSYDNYRLLQMLVIHMGLALTNATLHAEVRRLANLDMLTGLYVRHYLDNVIHERQAHEFCGSLIVVDIDQFKQVNDTFGHQTGDQVLKQVSDIVVSSVRPEDICARWGGEELAIYMPQLGIRQALEYAETIRLRVSEETRPSVTVSSGIAEWSWMDEKVSVESLFYRADMALYQAKHGGRNRIVLEEQEVTR